MPFFRARQSLAVPENVATARPSLNTSRCPFRVSSVSKPWASSALRIFFRSLSILPSPPLVDKCNPTLSLVNCQGNEWTDPHPCPTSHSRHADPAACLRPRSWVTLLTQSPLDYP